MNYPPVLCRYLQPRDENANIQEKGKGFVRLRREPASPDLSRSGAPYRTALSLRLTRAGQPLSRGLLKPPSCSKGELLLVGMSSGNVRFEGPVTLWLLMSGRGGPPQWNRDSSLPAYVILALGGDGQGRAGWERRSPGISPAGEDSSF